jgi:hypothetical protein
MEVRETLYSKIMKKMRLDDEADLQGHHALPFPLSKFQQEHYVSEVTKRM